MYSIRDPELIKKIAIKDFEYFEDHRTFSSDNIDPIFLNGLTNLTGEKWRHMRATLSPAFTGSKMRQMFGLITEYADDLVKSLLKKSEDTKLNYEIKDFFSRYTNDVIATCAFGLKINSIAEPNNEFYVKAKEIMFSSLSLTSLLKFYLIFWLPKLTKIFTSKDLQEFGSYFKTMILDTMRYRKEHNIYRPDMINMLMQVREGSLQHQNDVKLEPSNESFATVEESEIGKQSSNRVWSDDELVAQCFLFFGAGLDPSSTAMTYAAYELLANPDIQQKLYEEIIETNERIGDKQISYDELQKMKYLDQVVTETLRKRPVAPLVDRICVKDYDLDDGHKLKLKIEKGKSVSFNVHGIHHDEKYYPEPERFNPDRFSDENKSNIISGTYLPFGIGPRNCIGKKLLFYEYIANDRNCIEFYCLC